MTRRGSSRAVRARRRAPARGITFLETVAATVLVGLAAASLASMTGFVAGSHRRHLDLLGAGELANRLMLQYIDDPKSLPNDGLEVAYGDRRYRWSLQVSDTVLTPAVGAVAARTTDSAQDPQIITVSVWLSDSNGGTYSLGPDSLAVTLTRLYDPQAITRNTDALIRQVNDVEEFLKRYGGIRGGAGGGSFGSNIGGPEGGAGGSGAGGGGGGRRTGGGR